MQALPRACSGKVAINSALKSTFVHQQRGCFTPVSRSISIAHWFSFPQSGQRVADIVGMRAV